MSESAMPIEWLCEVCEKPIADGDGYITVDYAAIHAVEDYEREQDEKTRAAGGLRAIPMSELLEGPDPAHWRTLHRACDPNLESCDYWIGIERIRTLPRALSWTAHLLGKNWIQHTDWYAVIRRLSGRSGLP